MTAQPERLHAVVRGVVQGVNFRAATRDRARRLKLAGWIRNRPDGDVELVAEGPRDALEDLLHFLHRGPPAAAVNAVEARWAAATGEFAQFDIQW